MEKDQIQAELDHLADEIQKNFEQIERLECEIDEMKRRRTFLKEELYA